MSGFTHLLNLNFNMHTSLFFFLITIISAFLFEVLVIKTHWLREGFPAFENIYLFNCAIVAISSFFLISWLIDISKEPATDIKTNLNRKEKLLIVVTFFLSILFVVLFYFYPSAFSYYAQEDRIIEYSSALFCFAGFFILISSVYRLNAANEKNSLKIMGILALSLVILLIGLEEVSWFQRILDIDHSSLTPDNRQQELNLHNYFTNEIENAWYFSSFVLFILLPFIFERTNLIKRHGVISLFIPDHYMLFIGSVVVSYNYDMVNVIPIQLAFFSTFFILISRVFAQRSISGGIITELTIALLILTQVTFISFGRVKFHWLNDLTEYKEFFITLAILYYCIGIFQKCSMSPANK